MQVEGRVIWSQTVISVGRHHLPCVHLTSQLQSDLFPTLYLHGRGEDTRELWVTSCVQQEFTHPTLKGCSDRWMKLEGSNVCGIVISATWSRAHLSVSTERVSFRTSEGAVVWINFTFHYGSQWQPIWLWHHIALIAIPHVSDLRKFSPQNWGP